jgi:SAM-dependent methyltransferase
MPFQDKELRGIFMMNVLHHIHNSPKAFYEFSRCLKTGGKILIVDQYPGFPSRLILKYAHHEPFYPESPKWEFADQGPLSGANGALAWIIFFRDRKKFEVLYPDLKINKITIHSPLRYWLTGGLKKWNLLPVFLFNAATFLDQLLVWIWPGFGSFMDIEIEKIEFTKDNI